MYEVQSLGRLLRLGKRGERRPRVARNVVILGVTSLLTDISSEMVTTVLPLYIVFALGASPFIFGIVDALNQGASALVRVAGGFWADRSGRHKSVAVAGYGLSAVSRVGLLAAGGVPAFLSFAVLVDRIGKGIRTGPRDAIISLSTRPEALGIAFGVHRAMDTAGAMLGPLLAFGLLALVPGGYDVVFVVSLCFGVLGVGVIVAFAENPARARDEARGSADVAKVAPVTLRSAAQARPRAGVPAAAVVGSLLALVTVSDAFVYLAMQRRVDFDPVLVPLLFVGSAAAYMTLAVPAGRLADRFGRVRVFLAGHLAARRALSRAADDDELRGAVRRHRPRPARRVLRCDRRRPHGPREHLPPRTAARQRPLPPRHRDEPLAARRLAGSSARSGRRPA